MIAIDALFAILIIDSDWLFPCLTILYCISLIPWLWSLLTHCLHLVPWLSHHIYGFWLLLCLLITIPACSLVLLIIWFLVLDYRSFFYFSFACRFDTTNLCLPGYRTLPGISNALCICPGLHLAPFLNIFLLRNVVYEVAYWLPQTLKHFDCCDFDQNLLRYNK